jgi:hypothetical protein
MSRDLLKEAIADAKAVKETAIANAKAALAESFAPHLRELFAAKINELEEGEMEEGKEMKDDKKAKGKKEMEERLGTINDPEGSYEHGNLAEDELEEEMDLEELLAELSKEKMDEEEMYEEDIYEGLYEEEDEMGMEMGDEEMGEPTDEEMEAIIQDVIADMIENGELVAGPNFDGEGEEEMEMGDEEMDTEETMDEEVNLDELLAEIKKEMAKETMSKKSKKVSEELRQGVYGDFNKWKESFPGGTEFKSQNGYMVAFDKDDEELGKWNPTSMKGMHADDFQYKNLEEYSKMKKDLEEAYSTIKTLRSEMNEVNLLNAKLLYTNKVFRAKNLTESQKVKVLETFDKATTVKEVKLVFESLSFDTKPSKVVKNSLRESLGGASKALGTSAPKKPILEVNEQFTRMQRLAGIIK